MIVCCVLGGPDFHTWLIPRTYCIAFLLHVTLIKWILLPKARLPWQLSYQLMCVDFLIFYIFTHHSIYSIFFTFAQLFMFILVKLLRCRYFVVTCLNSIRIKSRFFFIEMIWRSILCECLRYFSICFSRLGYTSMYLKSIESSKTLHCKHHVYSFIGSKFMPFQLICNEY